ncbi:putative periplasmic lipoprotein [Intestinirhabdus alba]|uniref:PEGA domain-containing protein n=1 Tax=Intestinirhabdus alba TaxID=2899544 RepID=A0A6L6IVA2_9ENTR|nr:hypothetical protein [Intestinirhabdus alba]MTH48663.1 hypothetical protein [Intestinirhabdus alba]
MKNIIFLLFLPLVLTGCATIVNSNNELVYIDSTPADAHFVITDGKGLVVASGKTPQTVTLKKSDGSYFGKQDYMLMLRQQGYYSANILLEHGLSRWYTFGNLIFFGVPGWLVVDPFFGGMYTLKEERVHVDMRPCAPGPYTSMCS